MRPTAAVSAAAEPYGPAASTWGQGLRAQWCCVDPIMALSRRLTWLSRDRAARLSSPWPRIAPGGAGPGGRAPDWAKIERAFDHARSQSELELRQLELDTGAKANSTVVVAPAVSGRGLRFIPFLLAANVGGNPGSAVCHFGRLSHFVGAGTPRDKPPWCTNCCAPIPTGATAA
jgi:hypothetical protein